MSNIWTFRSDTNDLGIIQHVFEKNAYKLPNNMEGKIVIDIGAHIGSFSLLAATRGAKVFSFEPEKNNFTILEKNIENNNLKDQIIAENVAVGIPGEKKLYIDTKNTGQNTLREDLNSSISPAIEMVRVISLRDIFTKYNIERCDFIKIDCEGGEIDILPDVYNLYDKIQTIAIELHFSTIESEQVKHLQQFYNVDRIALGEYVCKK
jgi:FkbM family methyltransferase